MKFLSSKSKKMIYLSIFISFISSLFFLGEIYGTKEVLHLTTFSYIRWDIVFNVVLIYFFSYGLYYIKLKLINKTSNVIGINISDNYIYRYIQKSSYNSTSEDVVILYSKKIPLFLNNYLMELYDLIYELFFITLSFLYILYLDYRLLILIAIHCLLVFKISKKQASINNKLIDEYNRIFSEYTKYCQNTFDNALLIRSFEEEDSCLDKIKDLFSLKNKILFNLKFNDSKFHYINLFINNLREIATIALIILLLKVDLSKMYIIIYISSMLSVPILRVSNHIKQMGSVDNIKNEFDDTREMTFIEENQSNTIDNIQYQCDEYSISENILFNDFSLEINRGESYYLYGKNGSGKSSAMKNMLLMNKNGGKTLINKCEIKNINELYGKFIYVSSYDYLINLSVADNIKMFGNEENVDKLQYNKIVNLLDINEFIDTDINLLSDGERQKVLLARAIYSNVDVIVLDEAFSFVDKATTQRVMKYLINEYEGILIVIEHLNYKDFDVNFDYKVNLDDYTIKNNI